MGWDKLMDPSYISCTYACDLLLTNFATVLTGMTVRYLLGGFFIFMISLLKHVKARFIRFAGMSGTRKCHKSFINHIYTEY